MKILILGAGAIGSNLTALLVADLRGEHEITVLDFDKVEQRNIDAGTQFYMPNQVGLPKVEALQFNIYKWYQKEIKIVNKKLDWNGDDPKLLVSTMAHPDRIILEYGQNLTIDCLDNHEARLMVQDRVRARHINCLHIGFSDELTFAVEWAENYKVPTDITSGIDICTLMEVGSFVKLVASIGSLVAQEFINNGSKLEYIGNKLNIRPIR